MVSEAPARVVAGDLPMRRQRRVHALPRTRSTSLAASRDGEAECSAVLEPDEEAR